MISVSVPVYMINKADECNSEDTFVNFNLRHREKVSEILEELRGVIPHTISEWIDDDNRIKTNIIVVYNDTILNKSKLNEPVIVDGASLEFLKQFAGG